MILALMARLSEEPLCCDLILASRQIRCSFELCKFLCSEEGSRGRKNILCHKMRVLRGTTAPSKRKLDATDETSLGKSPKKLRRKIEQDEKTKQAVHKREEDENEIADDDDDDDICSNESSDESENEDVGISAYEQERLKNIQQNELFFKELKIDQAKSDFALSVGKQPKSEKYGLKKKRIFKPKEVLPPRQLSLRIRKLDPTGVPLPDVQEKEQQQSLSDQFKRVHRYIKGNTPRVGLHSFNITYKDPERRGRKDEASIEMLSCNDIDEDVCKGVVTEWCDHSAKCSKKTTVKVEESSFDLQEYRKSIESLSIADNHAAKVVPERIFSIIMHPMETKMLVFVGDKWGKIGIRDVDSTEGHDGVFLFEPHTKPINVLSFKPTDYTKVYSCSYDGTIRCGDMEKQQFVQVYATPEEDDILLNGFAWLAKSDSLIMVAKNDYTVGLVDIRTGKEERNFVAHGKSVRWVDCHPLNENYLVSASQDGSVATWDLRNIKNIKSKISEIRCSRVVSSSFYSPQTGNKILVTSLDDTIRVYDVNAKGGLEIPPKCVIKHNNQTGRWLTKFRAAWDPKTDNCFLVGNMYRPRAVDFYTSEGKGSLITQMSHENLSSITSLNVFHPTLNVIAGGNSSGKVFLWK